MSDDVKYLDFDKLDEETIIWRYIDFTKFISILETKALYFNRSDKLQKLDPYEGSLSMFENIQQQLIGKFLPAPFKDFDILGLINNARKSLEKDIYINCWHMNEFESFAMWEIYAKNNASLAIKTTIKKLKKVLENNCLDIKFFPVQYCDLKKEIHQHSKLCRTVYDNPCMYQYLRKSKYFEYEKELRLVHILGQEKDKINHQKNKPDGLLIDIELENFLDEIYINPTAESWFIDLVASILNTYAEKYNLNFDKKILKQSNLSGNKIEKTNINEHFINATLFKKAGENLIANSSIGEKAKNAIYYTNYDPKTGRIIGFRPNNIEYSTEQPEPYIELDWEHWQLCIQNQGKYIINPDTKELIEKT